MADLKAAEDGLAEKAATDERQRIAREVHDVIAHSLTVTMLHITAARLAVGRGDDEAATEALLEAERVGPDEPQRDPPDGRTAAHRARRRHRGAPAHAPCDIVQLVDGFADGRRRRPTGARRQPRRRQRARSGSPLFRVVQESLANAVRHHPGLVHRRRASSADDELHVRITVRGRAAPPVPDADPATACSGMRERVEALRGTLRRRTARAAAPGSSSAACRRGRPDPGPAGRRPAAGARRLDPHPRAGARLEIVGECSDGDEVEAAVAAYAPDVVLMDVRMKRMDGAEATRRLRQAADAAAGAHPHDLRRRPDRRHRPRPPARPASSSRTPRART